MLILYLKNVSETFFSANKVFVKRLFRHIVFIIYVEKI